MRVRILCTAILLLMMTATADAQRLVEVVSAGYSQVPTVRTPGIAVTTLSVSGDTLRLHGEFMDLLGNYRSGYIHYGVPGRTGHRMFRLTAELDEDRKNGVFRREDNEFVMTEAQRNALRRGLLYINITTDRHRHGEIRGQIPGM